MRLTGLLWCICIQHVITISFNLQGVKRMLTFMQRVFPTDPSRSVDFDGFKDGGRGAAGAGSDKLVPPAFIAPSTSNSGVTMYLDSSWGMTVGASRSRCCTGYLKIALVCRC